MEPNLDSIKELFLSETKAHLYPGSQEDKERFFVFINETFIVMSSYVLTADVDGLKAFHKDFNLLVNEWYVSFKKLENDIKKLNVAKLLFGRSLKDPFKEVNFKTKLFVNKYEYSDRARALFANYK